MQAQTRRVRVRDWGRCRPLFGRLASREIVKSAVIISVALLSVTDYASKLIDRIDVRRRRARLEQVLIVAFAPTTKPTHHG
jgi:hypothetical protein